MLYLNLLVCDGIADLKTFMAYIMSLINSKKYIQVMINIFMNVSNESIDSATTESKPDKGSSSLVRVVKGFAYSTLTLTMLTGCLGFGWRDYNHHFSTSRYLGSQYVPHFSQGSRRLGIPSGQDRYINRFNRNHRVGNWPYKTNHRHDARGYHHHGRRGYKHGGRGRR